MSVLYAGGELQHHPPASLQGDDLRAEHQYEGDRDPLHDLLPPDLLRPVLLDPLEEELPRHQPPLPVLCGPGQHLQPGQPPLRGAAQSRREQDVQDCTGEISASGISIRGNFGNYECKVR